MVGLSMVLASSIMTHSIQQSIDTWIEQAVPADLFVTSGANKGGIQNQPVRPELAEQLMQVPGIAAVDRVRLRNVDYADTQILLLALDVNLRFSQHRQFWPFVSSIGSVEEVVQRMQRGEGVVIAQTLAHRHKLAAGDQLTLQTPSGRQQFLILGTITDYSSDQGAVFLDRGLYTRVWRDDLVDTFEPYLKPGADAQTVRREILARHGKQYRLFVLTNGEFRAEIQAMIGRIFSVTRALELVTVFISLLSVVNTLLTAILDRMREIGVLRAIGMVRRQLSRMIVVESLCLSIVGAFVGLGVGILNGWLILNAVNRQDTGWDVATQVPWETTGIYLVALIVVGAAAALYPARVAGRVPVVDALGYE
jgi:putative ABC transport system permease protein